MNKQQIAENLCRIKALKDALDAEIKSLRQHIPVGEKIETPLGDVNHVDASRTSYDEDGLLAELNQLGKLNVIITIFRDEFIHDRPGILPGLIFIEVADNLGYRAGGIDCMQHHQFGIELLCHVLSRLKCF